MLQFGYMLQKLHPSAVVRGGRGLQQCLQVETASALEKKLAVRMPIALEQELVIRMAIALDEGLGIRIAIALDKELARLLKVPQLIQLVAQS